MTRILLKRSCKAQGSDQMTDKEQGGKVVDRGWYGESGGMLIKFCEGLVSLKMKRVKELNIVQSRI